MRRRRRRRRKTISESGLDTVVKKNKI